MSVVDLPAAKAHLNISGTPTNLGDTELQALIDASEAAIGERVGPLAPVQRTVRVTPYPRALRVPSPAAEIVSITDDAGTAVAVNAVRVDTTAGLIYYLDGSSFARPWYDVVYEHGHDPCPADLILAVKEQVRHVAATQRGSARKLGPQQDDTVSNTVPGAAYMFPFRVSQLLAPHMPQLVG